MCKRDGSPFKQTVPFPTAIETALATAAVVAEPTGQKAAPATKVAHRARTNDTAPAFRLTENNELVLSATAREEGAEAEIIYGPVAEYLSTVLGRKVIFKHSGNRGAYQGLMQKGACDIVDVRLQ